MGFIALERARLHYVFENIFHVVERLVSEKEAKMNKIFKVIWSKSKQCYVVVSEMAKNTTGKKKIVVAGILASLMMQPLATMDVDASASFGYSNKKGSISINGHSTSNATASEENAIAIGQNSNASGRGGISLGNDTSAAWNAFAGGWNAKATGKGAVALGQATANSESAIALGTDTSATANSATAIGNGANASKSDAIAVGTSAAASESNSIALGKNTQAKTSQAIAVGEGATADGTATIAIGAGNSATGWGATAIGKNVQVTKERSTGLGWDLTVDQSAATLVGYNSQVHANQGTGLGSTINITSAAQYGTGIGYQVDVSGKNAVAIGSSGDTGTHTTASATDAVSIGTATVASGEAATAIGKQAAASGSDAVSIGTSSKATGSDSLALGKNANASNSDSIAIGQDSVADSINGVALGKTSKATGSSATALGPQSTASGTYSTAIGMNSVANKEYAIAIGGSSQATVERGVALGTYSIADTASGVSGYDANTNRTNKYAGLTGKALTSTWGAVSIGDSTNTRQITGLAAGTKDTDAVNVAQLKSVNLAFTGDNSSSGDVNLANSKLAITGDTTYITTTAASQGIAIKGVKKDITVSNGTASASAGMADAKNVAEAINQANADQKITYKANSGTTNSVKLSDGLNFTNGTSTVATVGNNGQVTYDLNAATKKSIADSETAVKRTISLGADSGTRSSQSLNDNNVDFNVKGSSGSYITTSMAGNTVTINTTKGTIQSDASGTASLSGADGLATAQNVATAINQAKEGSAWNLAVNSGAAQKVSGGNKVTFKDGKNISLTQTGTTITVGTTDQLTADNVTVGTGANQIVLNGTTGEVSGKSIKAGNTIMNTSGLTISGGPSVTSTGINAGNKVISGVSQAVAGTDAVNKNQMDAAVKAVADSTSELGKNTITLATQSGSTTGQTLNSATGIKFYINGESGSDALISTSASGTNVSVAATQKLKDAVTQAANAANKDLSNLSTAGDTHIKGLAKTAATWNVSTNGSNNTAVAGGETVNFINGDNIAITNTGRNITIGTAKNVSFDKVTVGGVTIDKTDGINAGGKAISNVGTGRVSNSSTDDGNVANIGDVKAIANDAVSNLSTSLGVTDGTNSGTVNLKNQSLKVVGTGAATASLNNQTITVDVAEGTFTNKSDGTTTATAGVAKAADVATAINNANTALSQKITDATGTLGNNTFTLKADSTDTTAQALNKSGGLAFKVAGDGDLVSTSATTDTVNVTVKKGTLSTNTDGTINKTADGVVTADNMKTVVNDAITKAVTSAKDGSAWNISTNGGTATKVSGGNTVDLINGDNIEITQDGTGKKITVKTKKDLTLDSVTAANTVKVGSGTNLITLDGTTGAVSGNTFTGNSFSAGTSVLNTTGFHITGGPSVTAAGIDAGNKPITNVASGGTTRSNAATVGDVNDKVTQEINNLTTNLTKNTSISYTANNDTPVKTVSLKDGFKFTNGTLTTAEVAAGGVVKFHVTQGSLSTDTNGTVSAGTTGVATTSDVASAVNSAVTAAVTNATGNQKLDISAGGTDSSVNLKTQKLTVAGTGAATASLNGQTITVDVAQGTFTNKSDGTTSATAGVAKATDVASAINNANTALSQKITDATTSLGTLGNNTFTLKADSTDTTAQALNKSGGLAFKVAGDGDLVSTSATTDAVKVTVKKGELSNAADGSLNVTDSGVVTADNMKTVVNDAITKAVTSAKDGSAWNISTNGGTATKVSGGNTVDLINGDNIEITQDGTDGKKITVKTKKDLTLDSVTAANTVKVGSGTNLITLDGTTGGVSGNSFTAGNASMNTTGFRVTGGPSVTTAGIDAGGKQITNMISGGTVATNAATIGDVNTKVTTAINDLTTNLTKNTNIAYTANTATPGQTVSLKDGFNFTNGTLTTAEVGANGVVKFNVTQGALSTDTNGTVSAGTAGVATTADVASAVNSAVSTAVNNATGNQKLDISAGGTDSSVNLKTQKLTVAGTGAATASLNGQTITVDVAQGTFTNKSDGTTSATAGVAKATDVASAINNANTALSQKITDATTSLGTLGNNTFTLKADSTDTTAQALNKSGGLAFKVAGDGDLVSTSATTDAVKVTVKKGELSNAADGSLNVTDSGVVTADNMKTVVNDAITKAVTSAKDGSAWNISTNGGTATKVSGGNTVDLINGDNIEITQDGTDGKKITVKTKKDLTVDSVKAANTVKVGSATNLITLDGTTGAVSSNTFTAGNASMNTTGFRLTGGPSVTTTGIDAGNTVITNVASGGTTSTNAANIGDITKAISDLTTNLTKNTNISYTANTTTPGQTVSLKDGFNFSNGTLTTAEVAAGGVVKFNVTQGSLSTDGNGNITNTAGVATTDDVKNAVNTAINKAVTNSSAAVNTLGANTFTLTGDNSTSTTGQALNKNGGLSFKVAGDGNFITTSAATDTVTVSIKQGAFGSNTDGTAKSTTNGVATTNDVANIVNTTVTNAVTKATGAQVLNITDGNNNGSINLKNDALKVVGTDGVTTEVSGKTITVGLDTATKDKINNASVATNKNISLAADSGTISSQSLKDGDVSFAVKGATGDYISTNMNGSTVEISTKRATIDSNATTGQASVTGNDGLATAKNVADAINAATAKAVSQSAWKLAADGTTGTETISGGDTVNFKAGSNMEVSRTGKDITYKTKDNVAFTTVTAGTGANEVKLDGNTGTVTAKDITATGDVTAKNVTTSGNVTAAGTLKGDTVQGNTVKAGNVTITGGTTNTITGLSNTTWTGSTTTPDRAATEGQLQQAISSATSSATFKFDADNNSQQTMNLQNGTFKVTGDTMITTNATSAGIGLSLNTNNVKIAYAANGLNGQTTSIASGLNFTDGDHTKATVAASGVVKYDAKTSTISVANGHAAASGNDLATADNVADAINQMTQNNAGNTTQLRQEISKVATETQRVGAHAAAMAALKPIQYDPLAPTQIMAGVGNYRGESAAALGIAHYTNDNTMFNVGVSVGGNHNMINAGVTHKFGISAEKKNIPDRYKAGPISSIYVMQDEMTQLRSENEAYKAKLDKQQSEIDALKAAVDQLLASKA